jgi:hypothetical protein
MACAITAGYVIGCRESIGGIDAVYIAEAGNVTLNDVSGTITGITKLTGKKYFKFEVPTKSTATATSEGTGSTENGTLFFEQTVELPLNKRDATTRNIVTTLAKNKLSIITKDKDGVYRAYGKVNGMYLDSTGGMTGAAAGDKNGFTLKFSGTEIEDFFVVADAVGQVLETAG